jgi:endonuclease I
LIFYFYNSSLKKIYMIKTKILFCVAFVVLQLQSFAQVIISQYYEGAGTNKWIELTNLGTTSVNTASPQLKLGIWSASGSTGNIAFTGAASATLNLAVTIPAKGSILIGNTTNGTEVTYLTAASAAQTSNTVIAFNGNDGIALLNASDVVIDRFGTGINATDISYVRSTSVTAPTATYISSQWASASLATVSGAATGTVNRLGYHVSPGCTTPAAPTGLSFTTTSNSVAGSFTAASGTNAYLVVRSSSSSLSANPANGTTYATGNTLGGGTVLTYGTGTSFSAASLAASTTYYFFVFSGRTGCTGAPVYSSVLSGNATTSATGGGGGGAYYDAAAGLTCQPLKTALKNIIKTGFNTLSYTPGIWNIYRYSDIKRNDANTADVMWDMYSDNPTGVDPYTFTYGTNQCGTYSTEGQCYNREHSTPQSWFNQVSPMVSDAHHIFATDGKVNAMRSNFPYGEVTSATSTSLNGSKLGTGTNNFGYAGTVFEPINEYKGDFARACLYMATRYEDEIIAQNWSSFGNANEVFLSATDQAVATKRRLLIYDPWYLQLLIKWHNQDPVSTKEINRNNAIYNQAVANNSGGTLVKQGNRNPFVDHPEYVAAIWGSACANAARASFTAPEETFVKQTESTFNVYPNPASTELNIEVNKAGLKNISLLDANGKQVLLNAHNSISENVQKLNISSLAKGNYFIKIVTENNVITKMFTKQ